MESAGFESDQAIERKLQEITKKVSPPQVQGSVPQKWRVEDFYCSPDRLEHMLASCGHVRTHRVVWSKHRPIVQKHFAAAVFECGWTELFRKGLLKGAWGFFRSKFQLMIEDAWSPTTSPRISAEGEGRAKVVFRWADSKTVKGIPDINYVPESTLNNPDDESDHDNPPGGAGLMTTTHTARSMSRYIVRMPGIDPKMKQTAISAIYGVSSDCSTIQYIVSDS
jgi:hypothetical protein